MIQAFIGPASLIELQMYPVNAKYHLQRIGLSLAMHCRTRDAGAFRENQKMEVKQLDGLYQLFKQQLLTKQNVTV